MKKAIFAIVVTLLVAGCAGSTGSVKKSPIKMVVDGQERDVVVATTTPLGFDRSSTLTQVGIDSGRKDKDGKPIYVQIDGGAELNTGTTVVGDVLRGSTVGIGAAYIQGEAIKDASKTKARAITCPDGVLACHGNFVAGSNASAGAQAGSNSSATMGCPNGGCLLVPRSNN